MRPLVVAALALALAVIPSHGDSAVYDSTCYRWVESGSWQPHLWFVPKGPLAQVFADGSVHLPTVPGSITTTAETIEVWASGIDSTHTFEIIAHVTGVIDSVWWHLSPQNQPAPIDLGGFVVQGRSFYSPRPDSTIWSRYGVPGVLRLIGGAWYSKPSSSRVASFILRTPSSKNEASAKFHIGHDCCKRQAGWLDAQNKPVWDIFFCPSAASKVVRITGASGNPIVGGGPYVIYTVGEP